MITEEPKISYLLKIRGTNLYVINTYSIYDYPGLSRFWITDNWKNAYQFSREDIGDLYSGKKKVNELSNLNAFEVKRVTQSTTIVVEDVPVLGPGIPTKPIVEVSCPYCRENNIQGIYSKCK